MFISHDTDELTINPKEFYDDSLGCASRRPNLLQIVTVLPFFLMHLQFTLVSRLIELVKICSSILKSCAESGHLALFMILGGKEVFTMQ